MSLVQVVLVGHALHHDLRALRLDYQPVIDTSLLLPYKCAPSLAESIRGITSLGWVHTSTA